MSFPLRLTADLAFALAARSLDGRDARPPVLRLSSDELFGSIEPPHPLCCERTELLMPCSSAVLPPRWQTPVIWIAGGEPLSHPGVARFTNALAASGRHVFLETSGASLKPRLHEFQPSPHFYLAVRFPCAGSSPAKAGSIREAVGVASEAVRMARLAGFFTWAHLVLQPDASDREFEYVHAKVRNLEVDECVLISGSSSIVHTKQAAQLRRRLLSRRCSLLSSLLDSYAPPESQRIPLEADGFRPPESRREGFGEGAEAS